MCIPVDLCLMIWYAVQASAFNPVKYFLMWSIKSIKFSPLFRSHPLDLVKKITVISLCQVKGLFSKAEFAGSRAFIKKKIRGQRAGNVSSHVLFIDKDYGEQALSVV